LSPYSQFFQTRDVRIGHDQIFKSTFMKYPEGIRKKILSNELMNHIQSLRRYAGHLVNDPSLADDLLQDTLMRALSHEKRFCPGTNLRAWLLAIMRNVFRNQWRQSLLRGVHFSLDDERITDIELVSPARQTERLEVRDIDRALLRLPSGHREVLFLIAIEEMTYADAALTLQIPIGTVMSRLSRARRALRQILCRNHCPERNRRDVGDGVRDQ
jgi:RNA polymerase sigma-70 factor, ECF subfamily